MKFGVVVFPGSNCDRDVVHVVRRVLRARCELLWHGERDLKGVDCVVLPGGFSYGDYLRAGAIARFSPILSEVRSFAARGGAVLGICNGFQILLEAGLLPGAMRRNRSMRFECRDVHVRVENLRTPFTRSLGEGTTLRMPIAHAEGNYFLPPEAMAGVERSGRVVFRYATADGAVTEEANPNGSLGNVAGLANDRGNVVGLMPHPERASEAILGSEDGLRLFRSAVEALG